MKCSCGNTQRFSQGVKFNIDNPSEEQRQYVQCLDCKTTITFEEIKEQIIKWNGKKMMRKAKNLIDTNKNN